MLNVLVRFSGSLTLITWIKVCFSIISRIMQIMNWFYALTSKIKQLIWACSKQKNPGVCIYVYMYICVHEYFYFSLIYPALRNVCLSALSLLFYFEVLSKT